MSPNDLIHEKSPYLLQHAHNPVQWYPWKDEVFERAEAEDKPVFLSIGYATCHWCHVMEKESFEDPDVAALLNRYFIAVKVDREERPDIDSVYMAACQMYTGSGGWPLSVFITPQREPFFAATYLPKQSRFGRPGMMDLCEKIHELWRDRRSELVGSATQMVGHLSRFFSFSSGPMPELDILDTAANEFSKTYDDRFGGFDQAPKFPMPSRLRFLLRYHQKTGNINSLDMVLNTLIAMRLGGIWDHVGLGFHRYSTDNHWLLPHFEKMLYDQALLALTYLEAFEISRDPFFANTASEIFSYVLRDMTDPEGGFYTAEDADSEGEEGKFYVWSLEDFKTVLKNHDADRWALICQIKSAGNFKEESTGQLTETNIPHFTKPLEEWSEELNQSGEKLQTQWTTVRKHLFEKRKHRVPPLKDDKILTDWNGLMIAALAKGATILDDSHYEAAAEKAAHFILTKLKDADGYLLHRYRTGDAAIEGQAGDYAFLVYGLLGLYRCSKKEVYRHQSIQLQQEMIDRFWDDIRGGFFTTHDQKRDLPVRPKELYDGALPSANAIALSNLLALHDVTSEEKWKQKASALIKAFSGTVAGQPTAYTSFLSGILN